MLSLRDLQRAFVARIDGNLLSYDLDTLIGHVAGGGQTAEQRLDTYTNTVLVNRQNALRATYPVVERLVGAEFFSYAAYTFAKLYPSRSGNLDDYGAEFAEFLVSFEPVATLPYLPDVARLELRIEQVGIAGDGQVVRRLPTLLSAYGLGLDRGIHLRAGSRLLKSAYPVHRIWQVNQAGYVGDDHVDLSLGGAELLIRRRGFTIEIVSLDPDEFAFLSALAAGTSLALAIAAARAVSVHFDATACLYRRIGDGTLADPDPQLGGLPDLLVPSSPAHEMQDDEA